MGMDINSNRLEEHEKDASQPVRKNVLQNGTRKGIA